MKKFINYLFLSCLKATELIEKKLLFNLSFKEKVQLGVHKKICDACANYEKHSLLIDHGMAEEHSHPELKIDIEQFKKSTLEKLNK